MIDKIGPKVSFSRKKSLTLHGISTNDISMRKILKGVGIAIAVPLLFFIILALLLYFPPFQRWTVNQVAAYAAEKTGSEIAVERVRLVFPLDLGIEGLRVIQPNDSLPQVKDTVADIGRLVVNVQLWPLLHKKVEVDALEFHHLKLNTAHLIHEVRVCGTVNRLCVKSHGIDLGKEVLRVNSAELAGAKVNVELSDTVPPDTAESRIYWKIYVDDLAVSRTDVTVHLPGDTLQVQAYLGKTVAGGGFFDLDKGIYRVQHLDWTEGRLRYDNNFKSRSKGLDFNHVSLTGVTLGADSLYYCKPQLSLRLRACSFREKSGIEVSRLTGPIALDSARLYLPDIRFSTTESSLTAAFDMDLDAFADRNPGKMNAVLHGSFGKQDLMRFLGDMPLQFRRRWPNYPLAVDGVVKGNLRRVNFTGLSVVLPTAFRLKATGYVADPLNLQRMKADADLKINTFDLGFITALFNQQLNASLNVPNHIAINGRLHVDQQLIAARLTASEGGGSLKADAQIDTRRMAYRAKLSANALPLQHFLPRMGLHPFTGDVSVTGSGTDIFSHHTRLQVQARVLKFRYGTYDLDHITGSANMRNGVVHADIHSDNTLLKGLISLDALTDSKRLRATVGMDIDKIDLYRLRILHQPLTVGLCGHVDMATNRRDYYMIKGSVSDITIHDNTRIYRPEAVDMDVFTRRDTTHAIVDCGDFHLNMDACGGYEQLMKQGNRLLAELQRQLKDKYIDQVRLRERLPNARIYLTSGKRNFFCRVLKKYGYELNSISMDMHSSPVAGLNGRMEIDSMIVDSIQLDTVRLRLLSNDNAMTYQAQVRNNADNPHYTFNALIAGGIYERGTKLTTKIYDAKNKLGLSIGVSGSMESNGIALHLMGDNPILGYKRFSVNDSNYVFLGDDRRVSANLRLSASDGTGIQVYTDDGNREALQDVTVSLNRFVLDKVLSVLPYTPSISGTMDGDFHVIQTKDKLSVSSDISVEKLVYEGTRMGDISTEFVYMPKSDGSHYVNGTLMSSGNKVATLEGSYQSKGEGYLDADLHLNRLPLSYINGFIPRQLIGFKGVGEGKLTVKGALSKPQVNGEVYLDSAYLVSEPYGVEMRFDNDPVRIVGSHLLFENFEMYAHNSSPLTVSGYFDFADLDNMILDVRMRTENFLLIDAKENYRSEAYGKAFVNFFGRMGGPIDNLKMRGKLDVLGATDLTYVLRDSPLTTDNQMEGLVKFTDFKDSTQEVIDRPPLTGLDMDMSIGIDENAHILCALNADKSNYVDLIGGGNLRMQYNTVDQLRLTGRYTLNNGEMKYSLPVIPLKTFTIRDGSYVEFLGDAMNPKLNITATETTKASVASGEKDSRVVDFECGVVITKTLKDMGLEFIINAPQDMAMANQLNTMSKEDRGKLAVTMLTTGMYLADGNTQGFSMNNALSAFLQSQINNITGSALRTLDLSFGLDNVTDASGNMHTDYSFKFSKRFWNNRLRIIIGGKVSTGNDVTARDNTFLNNVSFEYRLNQGSTRYLQVFYNRDSYDWLEGDIGKYGVGFIWRRKLSHFKDLFRFKDRADIVLPLPDDTLKVKTNATQK